MTLSMFAESHVCFRAWKKEEFQGLGYFLVDISLSGLCSQSDCLNVVVQQCVMRTKLIFSQWPKYMFVHLLCSQQPHRCVYKSISGLRPHLSLFRIYLRRVCIGLLARPSDRYGTFRWNGHTATPHQFFLNWTHSVFVPRHDSGSLPLHGTHPEDFFQEPSVFSEDTFQSAKRWQRRQENLKSLSLALF